MYKLIALDLDGTLLDSNKELPEENKNAVRSAVEKGIRVVICSGRIYSAARLFSRGLGIREPLIVCNGALIRDYNTGEILAEDTLGLEECRKTAEALKKAGIYHHAYIENSMYTTKLGLGSEYYTRINRVLPSEDRIDIKLIQDFSGIFKNGGKGAYKFLAMDTDEVLVRHVREVISQIPGLNVISSFHDNFEVMRKGVSKGQALSVLAEKLGIDRSEIIAVGDNENDLSMIEYAGLGVAMGNAEIKVKEIAGYITCNNNDCGVAKVFKKYVL